MKNSLLFLLLCVAAFSFSCSKNDEGGEDFDNNSAGVFVVCEGSFNGANASLSYYDPELKTIENSVFSRSNAALLGDVAQSMTIYGGTGYVTVNNSGVVFAIDPDTYKVKGKIENLPSPRYVCPVSDTKAYISDLYSGKLTVFNPQTLAVTGTVLLGTHLTGEQMICYGGYLFVACWSTDKTILVININNDEIVKEIEVGIQPYSIAVDKNGKLWCLCDGGGWDGNPIGYQAPSICRINTSTFAVEKSWSFTKGDYFSTRLAVDPDGSTLYYSYDKSLWKMSVSADVVPTEPFVRDSEKYADAHFSGYYGLGIDPLSGEVYLSDAGDYVSGGKVYRYDSAGRLLDCFTVGVCPSNFCFKTSGVK